MFSQQSGTVVGRRYRLIDRLGAGGMGSVWRARDEERGIDVALKFLHDSLCERATLIERFRREADLTSRMYSRNTVRVLERRVGGENDEPPYIVYELLEGEDLATHLDRVGRMTLAAASEIVVQVCRALERAHAVGAVHRDIKPANVFLTYEDDRLLVKVLDFGIAKLQPPRVTGVRDSLPPGSLTGTLEHMSPEHVLDGVPADVASDLYAVGVVGYRCVTGQVPFPADALGQLLVSLVRGPAAPPSSLAPEVPAEVDAFFARALHRDPGERFATASEMAKAAIGAFRAKPATTATASSSVVAPRSLEPGLPVRRVSTR